jgi:NADH dehydrogenase
MYSSEKMKKIAIIGEGYAGLKAIRTLARYRKKNNLHVTLFGTGENVNLPLLPDIVADNVSRDSIVYHPDDEINSYGFNYVKEFVLSIDAKNRQLKTETGSSFSYDKLIISAGSIPSLKVKNTYYLHSVSQAVEIRDRLIDLISTGNSINVAAVGGGYTGIEFITAVKRLSKKLKYSNVNLYLFEIGDRILPSIDEPFTEKIFKSLTKNGIKVLTNEKFNFENKKYGVMDLVCITAGFQGSSSTLLPGFFHPQSKRLIVSETLKVTDSIFAVGDCAHFEKGGKLLRPTVNYALFQGELAAKNCVRELQGKDPLQFKPVDLGYVVPDFISKKAYGKAFTFFPIGGYPAFLLHYFMCIYRSSSFKNGLKVLGDRLFRKKKSKVNVSDNAR